MIHASRAYQSLLLAYAAGALDEAQSLIVASHIALSDTAREYVHSYEYIGGMIIEKHCHPVAMKANALDCVLAAIEKRQKRDEHQHKPSYCKEFTGGCDLPDPLAEKLAAQNAAVWHEIERGLSIFELALKCQESRSRFLKMAPGLKPAAPQSPPPSQRPVEITLVLDGGFEDDTGHYMRGDMVIIERSNRPHHMACDKKGCLSLVVTSSPLQFRGIEMLIRPYVKN